jgi:predicted metalloprotease with PDZ domain
MTRYLRRYLGLTAFFLVPLPAFADEPARPIELSVDATAAPRKLLHARLVIPAAPGPLTLYYPKWIPGEHAPTGPITELSGVKFRAGGKAVAWRRDDVDLYAFHCTVPEGADALEVTLDYLAPANKDAFTSGISATERLLILNWNQVLLYPKGRPVREQQVRASLTLPRDWKLGTPLPIEETKGTTTRFKAVSLETLVDSPVLCGVHLKEVPLGPKDGPPHFLVLACDSASGLELAPELKAQYEKLVAEAGALFGARHYRSYRFLVTLSDAFRPDGIEHHECSDNRLPERFLRDDSYRKQWEMWLLAHEYVHSWNGKYRRPEGLATSDFQQPMKTRLLWVYEGLTQYLGFVLAARSGLYTPELTRENFALIADWARSQRGRTWRPLDDTTTAAPHLYSARQEWASRRRGVDFYDEGALLWLDVDTLLRDKSGGKKSLDDFCRAFFGGKDGPPEVKPYTLDDLVRALNDVVAHDWKGFLAKRVTATEAEPPLDGLTRGGWKVVYDDKRGEVLKAREEEDKTINLTSSIGLLLKDDGQIIDVVPQTAADRAGIGPGMKLLGVNHRRWTADRLREAVETTRKGREKLVLLLENHEYFKTVTLDYSAGEKYPHLERVRDKPDVLGDILRPRLGKDEK